MAASATQNTQQIDSPLAASSTTDKELSGPQWVSRFPGSRSLADLAEPFRSASRSFVAAVEAAGASVQINATYRPPERAYLMHYACKVARGEIAAGRVPVMPGLAIEWAHSTLAASKSAASAMAFGFGIVYPPALDSNHTRRAAIDMSIKNVVGKKIIDATGAQVMVSKMSDLNAIGATFGVIKLVSDPPHWSTDGH